MHELRSSLDENPGINSFAKRVVFHKTKNFYPYIQPTLSGKLSNNKTELFFSLGTIPVLLHYHNDVP